MTTLQGIERTHNCDKPGLKFCIWPKAFEHAAQTVVDRFFEEDALNQKCRSFMKSGDVNVPKVVKPTCSIAIRPRKLTLKLDNMRVTVCGQRKDKYGEQSFEKRVSGPFDVSITVIRSAPFNDLTYKAKASTEYLRFKSSSRGYGVFCSSIFNGHSSDLLGDIHVQPGSAIFSGNYADATMSCGNSDEPSAKGRKNDSLVTSSGCAVDDDDAKLLIRAFRNAVLEHLNSSLPVYSFPIGSSCDWMFNFRALSKPEFQNACLESKHQAAIYYNGNTVMLPTQAAAFPKPQNANRMLTIFISNHVINTIGYCFHQHDILNYNLTQADLIPRATVDNSTTSDISVKNRCLSDCFPDFSVKYPGASVEVNMASSVAPTATFSGQNLKVSVFGSAIFRAHLADNSLVNFLTIEVNMEVTVLLKMTMEKLIGTVTSILPRSITVVNNALESVNREVLKEACDLIATQFLSRKFDEISQKGIPLPCPLLSGVEEYENVEMWSADDFLRIDTDLKFHA